MLTGGSGFLGSHLSKYLRSIGTPVYTPIRGSGLRNPHQSDFFLEDLSELTTAMLADMKISVFIHCAGVAHEKSNAAEIYNEVNTKLTKLLAERCVQAGVKRFIFISSVGVNGCSNNYPFEARDLAAPYDAYTESKYKAERHLRNVSQGTSMDFVIIRPPLIYGPNAPGNFLKLVQLAKSPIPKPIGSIINKRSFVSVDNLSDFISLCMTHPSAGNETFLISDGCDLSTSEFLIKISKTLGKPPLLMPFPVPILKGIACLIGKQDIVEKLNVNLTVDIKKNKELLGWVPKVSVDDALKSALKQK
ncbi:NAD-dependent epimerase/dehydratase family protein [Idiomarina seosinensis]|nr:NAD-dependent epimerase/dehydratase family protein [Idiomarina seosinensis]